MAFKILQSCLLLIGQGGCEIAKENGLISRVFLLFLSNRIESRWQHKSLRFKTTSPLSSCTYHNLHRHNLLYRIQLDVLPGFTSMTMTMSEHVSGGDVKSHKKEEKRTFNVIFSIKGRSMQKDMKASHEHIHNVYTIHNNTIYIPLYHIEQKMHIGAPEQLMMVTGIETFLLSSLFTVHFVLLQR